MEVKERWDGGGIDVLKKWSGGEGEVGMAKKEMSTKFRNMTTEAHFLPFLSSKIFR